jgi:hypothetical protein
MLVLFRMLTGENWDSIMADCMLEDGCIYIRYVCTHWVRLSVFGLEDIHILIYDSPALVR